jgi:membrane fusion protein (multidrug efflux system)
MKELVGKVAVITGATSVLLTLSAWLFVSCTGTKAASPPPPPPGVAVAEVVERNVPITSEWIATLDGYVNAQVRPQVSGYLVKRNYREGAAVRTGDVLFEIDPRPFEATLAQARAQLAQAQAQFGRTARDVERDTPLARERAIAQSQMDNDIQANLAAQAAVESAQALLDTAQLNVGFTKVTSLVDGVAAIATAQIGDLVGPTTLLTTVSQIAPIKAYFAVSEQEYLQMAVRINGAPSGQQLWDPKAGLELILSDGSVYPNKGTFLAADREVDLKTGTIRLSAVFPNPGNILRPGQYGRVRANTRTLIDARLIPQRSVSELQDGYQVRVVGPDNRIGTRAVTLGDRLGRMSVVLSGLKPGDRVAVQGAQFAKDGALVTPTPFTASTEGE